MSQPIIDYRQIGLALANHLNEANGVPSVVSLQGMIADLAADFPELLVPLRDLVTRPTFQGLIAKAGSGSGALQRDALINEVRPVFSVQVLDALTEVLDGFLNLPTSPVHQQTPAAEERHRQPAGRITTKRTPEFSYNTNSHKYSKFFLIDRSSNTHILFAGVLACLVALQVISLSVVSINLILGKYDRPTKSLEPSATELLY